MKKSELEKGVWYATTQGRRMSLGYCWMGGDSWAVVSWGANFNRYRRLQGDTDLLPYLVKTDLKRDRRRKRSDTFNHLMHWVNRHLSCGAPVEPALQPKPATFALTYMGNRLDPVVYLMILKGVREGGSGDYRWWVAEPRLATTFSEEDALGLLRSYLGEVIDYGSFTINWNLVRLTPEKDLRLGGPPEEGVPSSSSPLQKRTPSSRTRRKRGRCRPFGRIPTRNHQRNPRWLKSKGGALAPVAQGSQAGVGASQRSPTNWSCARSL